MHPWWVSAYAYLRERKSCRNAPHPSPFHLHTYKRRIHANGDTFAYLTTPLAPAVFGCSCPSLSRGKKQRLTFGPLKHWVRRCKNAKIVFKNSISPPCCCSMDRSVSSYRVIPAMKNLLFEMPCVKKQGVDHIGQFYLTTQLFISAKCDCSCPTVFQLEQPYRREVLDSCLTTNIFSLKDRLGWCWFLSTRAL